MSRPSQVRRRAWLSWGARGLVSLSLLAVLAWSLEPGEISEVVQTQFGYHIIRVSEKQEADVAPLDDVSPSIESHLAQQNQATALEAYVDELRTSATIVVNE